MNNSLRACPTAAGLYTQELAGAGEAGRFLVGKWKEAGSGPAFMGIAKLWKSRSGKRLLPRGKWGRGRQDGSIVIPGTANDKW
jgi:hypothetical protein